EWTLSSKDGELPMTDRLTLLRRRAGQAGLAVLTAILLVTGAAWRTAADSQTAAIHAAAPAAATPIAHAVAGGRDSYADVVKVVAPAVVTVRANGKARVSPTQFQTPDDDFLRRFFGDRGDQFDRTPRRPRTFRQSALGSGVIVNTDGYVLTNNHVIDSADDIKVDLTDGRTLSAKMVGSDKARDLAHLK